jgi:hypothetical protein
MEYDERSIEREAVSKLKKIGNNDNDRINSRIHQTSVTSYDVLACEIL